MTEAHGCEQLAQGCYSTARQPGLELIITESPVQCLSHYRLSSYPQKLLLCPTNVSNTTLVRSYTVLNTSVSSLSRAHVRSKPVQIGFNCPFIIVRTSFSHSSSPSIVSLNPFYIVPSVRPTSFYLVCNSFLTRPTRSQTVHLVRTKVRFFHSKLISR